MRDQFRTGPFTDGGVLDLECDMDEIPEVIILDAQRQIYEAKKEFDSAEEVRTNAQAALLKAEDAAEYALWKLLDYCEFLATNCEDEDYYAEVGLISPVNCPHHTIHKEAGRCVQCGTKGL